MLIFIYNSDRGLKKWPAICSSLLKNKTRIGAIFYRPMCTLTTLIKNFNTYLDMHFYKLIQLLLYTLVSMDKLTCVIDKLQLLNFIATN